MGKDEGGAGDVAGFTGAGRDVLQSTPVADEQANPRSPRQRRERWRALRVRVLISGSCPTGELPNRNVDADARAVITGISQGGQPGEIVRRAGSAAEIHSRN